MSERIEQPTKLSIAELLALDGFRETDPHDIFGVNFDDVFESLPPLAQSYAGIGSALSGLPLDSWARHGMHLRRADKFSSFEALTQGLSAEDKVRAVVILRQYLTDIGKRMPDFSDKLLEGQTLLSANAWVMDMIGSIDAETRQACAQAQIPGYEAAQSPKTAGENGTAEAATPSTIQTVMSATQRAQRSWFQRLFRRGQ